MNLPPVKDHNVIEDAHLTPARIFLQYLVVCMLWVHLKIKGYRLRVHGKENKPKGFQSYIIAANHTSTLDPPIVSVSFFYQPIAYMAKVELMESRWAPFYRLMACFSVNRQRVEKASLRSALKVLANGRWVLGIFPEGTRQEMGKVGEVKRGAVFLAKSANADIVPIGIYRDGPNYRDIEVCIGKRIPPNDDLDALAQSVEDALRALVEEAKGYYEQRNRKG